MYFQLKKKKQTKIVDLHKYVNTALMSLISILGTKIYPIYRIINFFLNLVVKRCFTNCLLLLKGVCKDQNHYKNANHNKAF